MLKNIGTMEKKPSILHQGNRKDAFRASQEMIRSYPLQPQGCKRRNSFERLCFEKTTPGHLPYSEPPKEKFLQVQLS